MSLSIDTITVGPMATNCYLVGDTDSHQAFIVDPGFEPGVILKVVADGGWSVTDVLITHGHFDHLLAAGEVLKDLEARFLVPHGEVAVLKRAPDSARAWVGLEVEPVPEYDGTLSGGTTISVGSHEFRVADTPGHSPGGISLIGDGVAFVGDTIFAGSIGRTDLPGGNYELLMKSIRNELLTLDDDTVLYCGHGPETTVGQERRSNPFILQMPDTGNAFLSI